MTSPQKHLLVKDSHVIASILKDLEIREYDPQIINLLLEFNHKYATHILDDAKAISSYAKNKEINVTDVKMAVLMAQDGLPIRPPTHEVIVSTSHELNKVPLPPIKHINGLRIPQGHSNLCQPNYILRNDLYFGDNTHKINTITTAAQILKASKNMEGKEMTIVEEKTKGDKMKDLMDIDLQEITSQLNNK